MATVAQRLLADRERFPSMIPGEIVIFRGWLRLHEKEYDRFEFAVRIGKGEDPGPTFGKNLREMWINNTRLRLDAVAYRGTDPTIIEVKDDAGAAAVGQLLTYKRVWIDEQRSIVPPKLILVTRTFSVNILPIIGETGIRLDQVTVSSDEMRKALGLERFGGRTK